MTDYYFLACMSNECDATFYGPFLTADDCHNEAPACGNAHIRSPKEPPPEALVEVPTIYRHRHEIPNEVLLWHARRNGTAVYEIAEWFPPLGEP